MKLFIQLFCYNEEKALADVIASLPASIDGVDEIRTLVIDDAIAELIKARRAMPKTVFGNV